MKNFILNKKIILVTAFLIAGSANSIAGVSDASSYQSHSSSSAVKNWDFPLIESNYRENIIIDSEPSTRSHAEQRLINRLGFTFNQTSRASRVHVNFNANSYELSDSERSMLKEAVSIASDLDRIVITSYRSIHDSDVAHAARAQEIKQFLTDHTNASIQTDVSNFWPGDPALSSRAEVFIIKHL